MARTISALAFLRHIRHRTLAALVVLLLAGSSVLSARPVAAAGADAGLVIAAVHVLQQDYVKPVDPATLLNAAIASLRKQTNLGADALPDIPSGTLPAAAEGFFRRAFAKAVQAGTVKQETLAEQATRDMLASLHDTHVTYMDPAAFRERQEAFANKPSYAGIGVMIATLKDASGAAAVFVTAVFPGSGAAAAGLQRFDRIVQINSTPVPSDATSLTVANLVRGPAGSTVTLTVQRRGQTVTAPVTRKEIDVPAVLEADIIAPGIGYIWFRQFDKGAGDQFRNAVKTLQAHGPLHGIILDLRSNVGGYFSELESVAGVFLPAGTTLAHVLYRQQPSTLVASGPILLPHQPLVVLTDRGTASSGEILTLALHDAHRAMLVGDQTAGALGGAILVPLPAGGMEVTTEEVDGPQYEQVEGVGIAPDQQVALTVRDMVQGTDTQLAAALQTASAAVK